MKRSHLFRNIFVLSRWPCRKLKCATVGLNQGRWVRALCCGLTAWSLATAAAGREGKNSDAPKLVVAAAADLQAALAAVVAEFATVEPQANIQVTYGASGHLYAQLSQGAPFDIFLSADRAYPQRLVEQGLTSGQTFAYATGQLVLWLPASMAAGHEPLNFAVLTGRRITKIALANPRHAPYGAAAQEALRRAGILAKVEPKLVIGENVAQAAQFAIAGAADAGLLSRSMALSPALATRGKFWQVPSDLYPPIHQAGVIMKSSSQLDLAMKFKQFLVSQPAQSLLRRHGFAPPES